MTHEISMVIAAAMFLASCASQHPSGLSDAENQANKIVTATHPGISGDPLCD